MLNRLFTEEITQSVQFTCLLQSLFVLLLYTLGKRVTCKTYLCNVDKFRDYFCPLLGCWLAENHELDPFGDTIK